MSVQPVEHRSTRAVQSPAVTPARIANTAPKKRDTVAEALRAAKAMIIRRTSLRKQRLLQKNPG
jgi:hypothetical protein